MGRYTYNITGIFERYFRGTDITAVSYTHLDVYKRQARASTVDIFLKTNLAVRPLPELEIEQEHHAQQNSSPDIRIQFMTCS